MVDAHNINNILSECKYEGEIGLLSIDIDGNDYWVWKSLDIVKPDIVICEYNAVFGDIYPVTIPYEADFFRTRAHYSNLYFGAGIKALEMLASQKGYRLIGSNSAGSNAFFLRDDLFGHIGDRIERMQARSSLARESRDDSGRLTFLGGLQRLEAIKDMPVLRLDTQKVVPLGSLRPLYGEEWRSQMGE